MHSDWPPKFSIKRHHLAKNVRLRILPSQDLQVVVPKRFKLSNIPDVLEENKVWILKNLAPIHCKRELPSEIHFPSTEQRWLITYIPTSKRCELFIRENEIVITGDIKNEQLIKSKLKAWIKAFAHLHLPSLFGQFAEEIPLQYKKIQLRNFKSRWGSCSRDHVITMNYKLIFLPKMLIRHVLTHELCHTIHFNHSPSFWDLVNLYDINSKQHRRDLKKAQCYVPNWID